MPWDPSDARRHTRKARTPHEREVWARIANSRLQSGAPESSAIRIANVAIKRRSGLR